MPLEVAGQVGPQVLSPGATQAFRQITTGEMASSQVHGRYYEQAVRGAIYMGGMTLTSISNATFTSATVGATATPIAGIWNPSTSTVNGVVLQAQLGVTMTAVAATGGGPYVWMASVGNAAISTGAVPWSAQTLAQQGSQLKNMAGLALTGLTNNLAVVRGSSLFGGSAENVTFTATAVAMQTQQISSVELIDGSFIVPPGAVLALMATTTPVAHSAASGMVWEEVLR